MVALLAEGVDRNFLSTVPRPDALKSPSSRRAWIEILAQQTAAAPVTVALLAEGVDRNISRSANAARFVVALLAEGVDRNFLSTVPRPDALKSPSSRRAWIEILAQQTAAAPVTVALLAEGVDRN